MSYIKNSQDKFYCDIVWQNHPDKYHRTKVVYVFLADPGTIEPTLTFFKCLVLEDSQDANSIFKAIKKAFEKRDLLALLDKEICKKSGLISIFREEKEWVIYAVFVTVLNWVKNCVKRDHCTS